MNCQDAREEFSALLVGDLRLTESAQMEVHVSQCTECQHMLEQLYEMRNQTWWRRAPVGVVIRPDRRILPRSLLRLAVSAALVMLVTGLAIYVLYRRSELDLAAPEGAPPARYLAEAPPAEPLPLRSPPGTPSAAPLHASALATLSRPAIGQAAQPTRNELMPTAPRPPEESKTSPASASALPPRIEKQWEPPREGVTADVVVQVSVQNRSMAERDVKTLLARLGGARLGRDQGFTMLVVVPRSNYGEFTRGLAQIGAWQMETGSSPLPDPVHVAVRLAR